MEICSWSVRRDTYPGEATSVPRQWPSTAPVLLCTPGEAESTHFRRIDDEYTHQGNGGSGSAHHVGRGASGQAGRIDQPSQRGPGPRVPSDYRVCGLFAGPKGPRVHGDCRRIGETREPRAATRPVIAKQ